MKVACVRCGRPSEENVCSSCRSASPANERPYDEVAWRRRSKSFLRVHKWCVLCLEEGLSVQATVADHYPETRKELLVRGIEDPDASGYLRPLCASHHARAGRHTRIRWDNDPA